MTDTIDFPREPIVQTARELERSYLRERLNEAIRIRDQHLGEPLEQEAAHHIRDFDLRLAGLDVEHDAKQQELVRRALEIDDLRSLIRYREVSAELLRRQTEAQERQAAALQSIASAYSASLKPKAPY
jgi:hypothetical protein